MIQTENKRKALSLRKTPKDTKDKAHSGRQQEDTKETKNKRKCLQNVPKRFTQPPGLPTNRPVPFFSLPPAGARVSEGGRRNDPGPTRAPGTYVRVCARACVRVCVLFPGALNMATVSFSLPFVKPSPKVSPTQNRSLGSGQKVGFGQLRITKPPRACEFSLHLANRNSLRLVCIIFSC